MKKILFFAEDVGAANYINSLLKILKDEFIIHLCATNTAYQFLNDQGHSVYKYDEKLINNFNIDLFVFGTTSEKVKKWQDILLILKNTGVVSIGVVDAIMSSDSRFPNQNVLPDYLVVPDKQTAKKYKKKFPQIKVFITGHLQWIEVLKKRESLLSRRNFLKNKFFSKIPNDSKIVFFISEPQPPIENNYQPINFRGWDNSKKRTHICFQEIIKSLDKLNFKYHIIFKLHPKDNKHDYNKYKNMIYKFEKGTELNHELMVASDLVVGMTSNLIFQSVVLGLPTISINMSKKEKELIPNEIGEQLVSVRKEYELDAHVKSKITHFKPNVFKTNCVTSDVKIKKFFNSI